MPGPPPRPERSATSDGRRGTQPTGHPQARTTETTLRPANDSTEDDEDRGPDVVKPRQVHWPQPGLVGQIERDEDCHVPRCPCGYPRTQAGPCGPRGGSPPVIPGTGSFPRPSRWIIAKTEKQEDGRLPQWKEVLSVAAGSLEEAYLWMTAAAGEMGWDPPQGEAGTNTGPHSDRGRFPQAE